MGSLRVGIGLRQFLTTFCVLALAMMFGRRLVAFGRVVVSMSVPRHAGSPWFELRRLLNAFALLSFRPPK